MRGRSLGILRDHGSKVLSRSARRVSPELSKFYEFSEFLTNVAKVDEVGASFPHKVTVHDSCHALRELGITGATSVLLQNVRGLELIGMPHAEECCGFGGTFAVKFGMISSAMGETKSQNALDDRRRVRDVHRPQLPDAPRRRVAEETIAATDDSSRQHPGL